MPGPDDLLHRHDGHKPKREYTNACTPCRELIPKIGCRNMCCRQLVVKLAQEDLDDGLETQAPFVDVLKRAPSGVCAYLDPGSGDCTVWERRPLACRLYDCQQDPRLPWRLILSDAPDVAPPPERCHGCGRPPRILVGASAECDGHLVCIDCGAAWRFEQSLTTATRLSVAPVEVSAEVRSRYWFTALMYRQQWRPALADVERRLSGTPGDHELRRLRAVLLTHLERIDEAEPELRQLAAGGGAEPTTAVEAGLDLAWLLTRATRDEQALAVLEALLPGLEGLTLMRAHLLLGKIHRRAARSADAARHYVAASTAVKPGPLMEEHFQELRNDGPESRAALERQLLLRAAVR